MPTSKNWKQKNEDKKIKYKENQAVRKYNLELEKLKNERIYNDNQYFLKEDEQKLKELQSKYEHEEKLNEQNIQFIIRMNELYNERLKIMIPLMIEHLKALKEFTQEAIAIWQNQINSTKDDIKKLEDEKGNAQKKRKISWYSEICSQIHKKQDEIDSINTELNNFIKKSRNDLIVYGGIFLPSLSEFVDNGNGLIANKETYLIENKNY